MSALDLATALGLSLVLGLASVSMYLETCPLLHFIGMCIPGLR